MWGGGEAGSVERGSNKGKEKGLMDIVNSMVIVGRGAQEGGRKYRGHKW